MSKKRLDALLHERGLVESRERGRRLILAGQVSVEGHVVDKVATPTDEDAHIEIAEPPPFVSRGGFKLAKALDSFGVDPTGRIAADVGASTGGFTDCLLQRGARRVYAIDVGYGQIHWDLRQDPRVIVMDRTNARYLDHLPELVDLVTIDVAFISLRLILPSVATWLAPAGQVIALIKPQFEAGPDRVGRGGVVRDLTTHREVLCGVLAWAEEHGWVVHGLIRSPITGAKGNVEFLTWLSRGAVVLSLDWLPAIREVTDQST
jgi:23S rRNA (cytidine1920-2'-O)/16S rRNA (cytidine1409-2'-O)-methyltransferase